MWESEKEDESRWYQEYTLDQSVAPIGDEKVKSQIRTYRAATRHFRDSNSHIYKGAHFMRDPRRRNY